MTDSVDPALFLVELEVAVHVETEESFGLASISAGGGGNMDVNPESEIPQVHGTRGQHCPLTVDGGRSPNMARDVVTEARHWRFRLGNDRA